MQGALKTLVCSFLVWTTIGYSAALKPGDPNLGTIQVVPVSPSPGPDHTQTNIIYPKASEIEKSSPIKGQLRIRGFALGTNTTNPRAQEIWNDPEGQSMHIFIDNQPYFPVNEAFIDALDDVENYFDQTADFTIPFKLEPGMHVIRAFPVFSYNESVKSHGAFAAHTFYYQSKKNNPAIDLSKPYLTYNEPQGEYDYDPKKNEPILLDFYLTNCELSRDGYKVRLTIDNREHRILTSWQPYYIYGLGKGMHHIRLELLDPANKAVKDNPFNDVTRTITLQ